MISPMRFFKLIVFAITTLGIPDAMAWGAEGHRLIAESAEAQLAPEARAEVDRLLRIEPGATMTSVATWADEVRRAASAPLHYVNLPPDDCTYAGRRDCAGGRCVVEALKQHLEILSSAASDAERLIALKYVIHLVGDIHQPLHVGLASDRGGNLFQVRAFGRGSNLHAVWDGDLIRRRGGGFGQLRRDMAAARQAGSRTADPALWAVDSCRTSRSPQFYPAERIVDQEYASKWDGVLVTQLSLAGRRLAEALNETLQHTPKRKLGSEPAPAGMR